MFFICFEHVRKISGEIGGAEKITALKSPAVSSPRGIFYEPNTPAPLKGDSDGRPGFVTEPPPNRKYIR